MRFSFVIATLLSVACSVNAVNTVVMVGFNGTLTFNPSTVSGAAVDDTVTFQFHSKNHTATQSTFASPCSPLAGGSNSGFMSVSTNATQFPQFTVTVKNATAPMWFYCAQKTPVSHCASGMVFAINAPSTGNTFSAFQTTAKATNATASSTSSATSSATSSSSVSATSSSSAPTSTITGAAMRVGGSAAGALTAVALLVGLAL